MSYKLTESQKAAMARFESALAKIPRIESMSLPVLPPPNLTVRDVPILAWTEGDFYSAEAMQAFYAQGLADGTAAERERCAKLCEAKVMREAGHGGSFGGYGPMEGDLTGPECAAAIRNDAVKEPQ